MVVVSCPVPGCVYKTDDQEPSVVTMLLQLHSTVHIASNVSRGPKLERPKVEAGISQEVWNNFVRRWDAFRIGSNISAEAAPIQLFQCADQELADVMLKTDRGITSRTVEEVLDAMRLLAVIPVARGTVRAELMQMVQSNDESFRTFAARVRGKAETCQYSVEAKCTCQKSFSVDYTDEAIRDVLLAGIASVDVRREALSDESLQNKGINKVISFVETREMARSAVLPSTSSIGSSKQCKMSTLSPRRRNDGNK